MTWILSASPSPTGSGWTLRLREWAGSDPVVLVLRDDHVRCVEAALAGAGLDGPLLLAACGRAAEVADGLFAAIRREAMLSARPSDDEFRARPGSRSARGEAT